MSKYQKMFPIGTKVSAFTEDGMMNGTVTIHTTDREEGNGLIVTFEDGVWIEYPYHLLDLDEPKNSYVILRKEATSA